MTVLYYIVAILILSLLVLAHEAGHFWAAKLTGMPVKGFNIGFGPAIWKHKGKDGVAYAVRIIPFGGYCAFADTDEEDAVANYYRVPVWKRMTMTLSGPLMNFLLAFVVAIIFAMVVGLPADSKVTPVVGKVDAGSPAAASGLQVGDEFLTLSGVDINGDPDKVRSEIQAAKGTPIVAIVKRDGKQAQLILTAKFDASQNAYLIGISLKQVIIYQKFGLGGAIVNGFSMMVETVKQLLQFLFGLFTQGKGANDLGSPIGIVTTTVDTVKDYGPEFFFYIGIFISVNLGLFNLLPIPALDGSKVVFLTIEAIRRKPVPPEKEGIITAIGFGFFILLFIFLAGRDIGRLFGLWAPGS